jgi:hypothetical protein
MILNAAVTFSLKRAAADVEEVGREFAVQLDDVHRRHGKACAIDHAADIAVELDVGEVIFARLDLGRVFLGQVAQFGQILVAEHRVRIEADLGVEHQQLVAFPFADGERVDFDLLGIGAEEGFVETAENLCACLARSPVSPAPWRRCGRGAASGRLPDRW